MPKSGKNQQALAQKLLRRGQDAGQAGDFAGAVAQFRRLVKLVPEAAEAHFHLANALRGLGRSAAAVAAYRRASELARK